MKIFQKDSYLLKIEYYPLYKFASNWMILGSLVTLILLESMIFTSAKLTCEKNENNIINCQLERFATFVNKDNTSISDPIEAKLIEKRPKGYPLYEIVIVTKNDFFSLIPNLDGNYKLSQAVVSKINNFIGNPNQKQLSVRYGGETYHTFPRIVLISLVIIGMYWKFITKVVVYTFDKESRMISIEKKNTFGSAFVQYSWDEILDINIEKNTTGHINVSYSTMYRLVFILTNNQEAFFTQDYPLSKAYARYIATNILDFIHS
jgi:hypothetical protein